MSVSQLLRGTPAGLTLTPDSPAADVVVRTTQPPAGVAGFRVEAAVPTADASLFIQSTDGAGDQTQYRWTVGGQTQGGIVEDTLQLFGYVNGGFEAQYLQTGPVQSATEGIIYGRWGMLNPDRAGTIPALALGANNVGCTTATATSQVVLSLVGTNNAGGLAAYAAAIPAPVITLTAGVGFTVTALAAHVGLIYNYILLG